MGSVMNVYLASHDLRLMLKPTLNYPHNINEGNKMSKLEKLTHVLWLSQYRIVRVPKYRFRVLRGVIGPDA